MRHAEGISLQRVIVHLLNPKARNGVVLSERALPLSSDSSIATFLAAHIQSSLHDSATRSARFSDVDAASSFFPLCHRMFADSRCFVDASRKIATRLNAIIEGDKRISPGALVVCFYTAANMPDVARSIALLKLDPSEVFRPVAEEDERGHRYVTFSEISDVVPTKGERLQKCAFIRSVDPRPVDYDLMILDRQKAETDEPAQYFTSAFLSCELAADSQFLTQRFYTSAIRGLNTITPIIGNDRAEVVRSAIDSAVHGLSINVDDWVSNLNISNAAKEKMRAQIHSELPDQAFSTDETVAKKLTKKRILKGRYNLKLSLDADHYIDVVKSRKQKSDPQKGDYVELVLHAMDLREVER